jgi:hypothetical protein
MPARFATDSDRNRTEARNDGDFQSGIAESSKKNRCPVAARQFVARHLVAPPLPSNRNLLIFEKTAEAMTRGLIAKVVRVTGTSVEDVSTNLLEKSPKMGADSKRRAAVFLVPATANRASAGVADRVNKATARRS